MRRFGDKRVSLGDRIGGAAVCAAAAAALLAAGCGAAYQTTQADREVTAIVAAKQQKALGRKEPFSVEPNRAVRDLYREAAERAGAEAAAAPPSAPPQAAPEATAPPAAAPQTAGEAEPTEPLPKTEKDAIRLSMSDAMRLAVQANRDYQSAKEDVYLAALALTFERYLFQPHPFATGTVNLQDDVRADERSFTGGSNIGVSQQLATGALVMGSLGLTALKFINSELGDTLDTALQFSITQPLWRGAGPRVVEENLVQAERNALYEVRRFARFEQTFAVSVASRYLGVLQQRQIVLNEWQNYQSLKAGRERSEWLAKAERLPEFQVDQARQDELRAYNTWITAREEYQNALDEFKVVLGIPVATPIALKPEELEQLTAHGLELLEVNLEDDVATALVTRLDLAVARDGFDDAKRKVFVAEDGLKGDVDLVASIGYESNPNRPESARIEFHKGLYSIGLDIDLPIDRLQERNALRRTQIDQEQAERAMSLLEDQVVLQVREDYRALEAARQSYEIQKRSVALAERRVESTDLLLQAGRADQRDVLDSQSALVQARNALTRALVNHTIAQLEFRRDAGTLVVDSEGQIHGWSLTRGEPNP